MMQMVAQMGVALMITGHLSIAFALGMMVYSVSKKGPFVAGDRALKIYRSGLMYIVFGLLCFAPFAIFAGHG